MSHPVVPDQAGPDGERVIGIIDLGSNSLRLMLVRILPDGSHTVLNQVKNMVRLGEGAFETGHLREESMARTINVLRASEGRPPSESQKMHLQWVCPPAGTTQPGLSEPSYHPYWR